MSVTKEEIRAIKKQKLATVKCLRSLEFSTRYFYKNLHNRKFVVRKHHKQIARALERVLSGKCRRLLISIPPRYGKTELAVKNFIAHGLSLNPAAKFIHLSASDALAFDNSEGTKDIVQSPEYRRLFPDVRIKKSTDSKKKWYTTAGGGVYATGAAGQVTGFGAGTRTDETDEIEEWLDELLITIGQKRKFGGALIIDDAIKPDDADADIKRMRVNRRWNSTIKSRLNSRDTPVIVIMQRLHPMDLIGYLKATEGLASEGGEWEELVLPALGVNDAGELEALDPSMHTVEDLKKMRDNADEEVRIAFQRQYQQNPKPREGLLFPDSDLKYYNPKEILVEKLSEYRHTHIDPADKGGDSLCAIVGYLIGNKIYVADIIFNTKGTDVNEPRCVEFLKQHACNSAVIESNSGWRLFRTNIKRAIEEDGSDCEVDAVNNTTNKHTRILEAAAFIRNHFVFREDCLELPEYRRFIEELTSYRQDQSGTNKNAHDDAPDSSAGLAKYFRTNFAHLWQVVVNS